MANERLSRAVRHCLVELLREMWICVLALLEPQPTVATEGEDRMDGGGKGDLPDVAKVANILAQVGRLLLLEVLQLPLQLRRRLLQRSQSFCGQRGAHDNRVPQTSMFGSS